MKNKQTVLNRIESARVQVSLLKRQLEQKTITEKAVMSFINRIEGSINNQLDEMWSEVILELQPIDYNNTEIVWEWHFWDHLVQDTNMNLDNYGQINENPQLSAPSCNPGNPLLPDQS